MKGPNHATHAEPIDRPAGGMTKRLKSGDTVSWNTAQGRTVGTVEHKVTGTEQVKGHVAHATRKDPQYRVRSDKTGKAAIHRPAALKKEG